MKFNLTLHKTFEIDTDKDWGGDMSALMRQLQMNCEAGSTASADDIHDAILAMLGDDIDAIVELDLDETDFAISIPEGTTLEIPEDPEDED